MSRPPVTPLIGRNYFVDETGDGTLFNRKGECIIGTQGCSRFFVVGYLDVADPLLLERDMTSLRTTLLTDPYFSKVPSMQPVNRKTAMAFHAKDDVAEVRREVFALLLKHELKFVAAVKNKRAVLSYVRHRNQSDHSYRYHPNELYEFVGRRLVRTALHKEDRYEILFAKRGGSDRTAALRQALETARNRFCEEKNIVSTSQITVRAGEPTDHAGLQAADYFLWALQRIYERREDRYVEYLRPRFRLVIDIDDTREKDWGRYYTQKNPLKLAGLETVPGI